jgi:hypothetical protein
MVEALGFQPSAVSKQASTWKAKSDNVNEVAVGVGTPLGSYDGAPLAARRQQKSLFFRQRTDADSRVSDNTVDFFPILW